MSAARIVGAGVLAATIVACGQTGGGNGGTSSPTQESNLPGDIPDSQTFVPYTTADGRAHLTVPQGWAQRGDGSAEVFSDKLLAVRIETGTAAGAPTADSVTRTELPALRSTVPGFQDGKVGTDTRGGQPVVLIAYRGQSTPDTVTGKRVTESVQRYLYWHQGHQLTLTMSAPEGTDTVDAWRTVTDSVTWS